VAWRGVALALYAGPDPDVDLEDQFNTKLNIRSWAFYAILYMLTH